MPSLLLLVLFVGSTLGCAPQRGLCWKRFSLFKLFCYKTFIKIESVYNGKKYSDLEREAESLVKYVRCNDEENGKYHCATQSIGCETYLDDITLYNSYSECQDALPPSVNDQSSIIKIDYNFRIKFQTAYRRCYNPTGTSDDDKVHCHLGECPEGQQWVIMKRCSIKCRFCCFSWQLLDK